jgi:hypothetical protein
MDENNTPIPFAKIWIKNYNNLGTVTNIEGYYKIVLKNSMNYEAVYSSLGYEDQTHDIIVKDNKDVRRDVYLHEQTTKLETVEVSTKKKNVGYEIVKHVIARKKELARPIKSYSTEVYIKGSETFDAKKKKTKVIDDEDDNRNLTPEDSFEEDKKKAKEELQASRLNMIETSINVNFQYPNKLKEIKTAQYKLGRPNQIYLMHSPISIDAYFNFYEGLLNKERLHDTPIVSPLHTSGILSYKYKLKEIITQGQDTIYRVHITPRSFGTSTLEGDLYIKKHEWVLTKVDLSMHKGNLRQYDDFRIIQDYEKKDSVWLVTKQRFIYQTKYGKETVKGQTDVVYSNYVINPNFGAKYFNNEIGITKDDAYEKDSVYWEKIRPVKLTKEEQRKKFIQDSVKVAHTKKEYLDSLDADYNKITFLKVAWWGVTYRDRIKKTQWRFPSVASIIKPINIAGPRIGAACNYFKKFENNQWINVYTNSSIGVLNKDYRGWLSVSHLYNPKKLASYTVLLDHDVAIINGNVPYLDYIDPANYYFVDRFKIDHNFELFNGFYINSYVELGKRKSMNGLEFYNWKGDELQTGTPEYFDPYNTFRTNLRFSYTPGQKYLTEPNKKIVLGSAWPTFSLTHNKGWKNILKSSIDYDKLTFNVNQSFNIGTVGKSKYNFEVGKYVNQDSVYYIDQKLFRQADVGWTGIFMGDPNYSFQNLAQAYNTRDFYFTLHYVHNFNGAIINKIPFMKKTGIRTVTGGGILFIPEYNNLYYQELFFGVERRFKILRQRLRIGGFAILSDSNYQSPKLQFKIRFNLESDDDLKYNF